MKTYTIKNSDIMHKGKIYPEGTTITLDDKDASSLSAYLVTLDSISSQAPCHPEQVILSVVEVRETRDAGSSTSSTNKKFINNKRSK